MAESTAALTEIDGCPLTGCRPQARKRATPKPLKARTHEYCYNGHTLETTILDDGSRAYRCLTLPGFAGKHDGAKTYAEIEAALDDFERLAAAGNTNSEAA